MLLGGVKPCALLGEEKRFENLNLCPEKTGSRSTAWSFTCANQNAVKKAKEDSGFIERNFTVNSSRRALL
jgi:hypothetical protein